MALAAWRLRRVLREELASEGRRVSGVVPRTASSCGITGPGPAARPSRSASPPTASALQSPRPTRGGTSSWRRGCRGCCLGRAGRDEARGMPCDKPNRPAVAALLWATIASGGRGGGCGIQGVGPIASQTTPADRPKKQGGTVTFSGAAPEVAQTAPPLKIILVGCRSFAHAISGPPSKVFALHAAPGLTVAKCYRCALIPRQSARSSPAQHVRPCGAVNPGDKVSP